MNRYLIKSVQIFVFLSILASCSLAPGMHMSTTTNLGSDSEFVFIESLNKKVEVQKIENFLTDINEIDLPEYKIGNGDQILITVWGLPEIFPIQVNNSESNFRRVDSEGNIFFPYVGAIKASNKTQEELRDNITLKLSKFFNDPQLDVSIARFNSQKVYMLGEVTKPSKINLNDVPLSLSDALGEVFGLNTNTANGSEVFIVRKSVINEDPLLFRANLSDPAGFITAGNFYLRNNDIVFVNAKGTTRWNKVISQFFPFSSFLNSIDNLTSD